MKIKQNFHFHSHHSCDSACAKMSDIIAEMKQMGIEEYCLTDHLHTRYSLSDIVSAKHDYLWFYPPENFHFGIEVSCMAMAECERVAAGDYVAKGDEPIYGFRDMETFDGRMAIDLDEAIIEELEIECVVAGIHWTLGYPQDGKESMRDYAIRNYFEQALFLINHPLVDVFAHPWDALEIFAGDGIRHRDKDHIDRAAFWAIPDEYNQELANVLLRTGKPAELNLATLGDTTPEIRHYMLDMLAEWKTRGVKFTIGDDSHQAHFSPEQYMKGEEYLTKWGFTEADLVIPLKRRLVKP